MVIGLSDRMNRRARLPGVALMALLTGLMTVSNPASAQTAGTSKGLVVTYFWYATYEGDNDCPDGPAVGMRRLAIPKLSMLPAAEQKRLRDPANGEDMMMILQAFALGGVAWQGSSDVREYLIGPKLARIKTAEAPAKVKGIGDQCLFPAAFEDPSLRTAQGKIGYGLNLDGSNGELTATACPHDKFISPTGEKGVDNQMQRVLGCIDGFRHKASYSPATTEEWAQGDRADGGTTALIEITGVTDPRNAPDVQVAIYDSMDATPYDSQRHGLTNYSLTAKEVTPGVANVAHGRIVDGVLTTDPIDLQVPRRGEAGSFPYHIKAARFRLTLQSDGSAQGILAGYMDIDEAYKTEAGRLGAGAMAQIDLSCPSFYAGLKTMADGYKDSKTGKCTALSTAFKIEAAPAFVIHPATKTADAAVPNRADK